MDAGIVERMREEEADLARKLQAVRDFLAAYGDAPAAAKTSTPDRPRSDGGSRPQVDITSFTEQTRLSVVYSLQALTMNPGLMRTKELVDFVEAMGHEISGKNKVNALGALLARSVDVVGHGKSGWSLADRENALAIVQKYAPKENEPESDNASGSDAAGWGVPPPPPASGSTPSWPSS